MFSCVAYVTDNDNEFQVRSSGMRCDAAASLRYNLHAGQTGGWAPNERSAPLVY